ncbi:DUF4625 domain-containing protein [Ancylomarina sp. YFZ004]
MQILKYVIISLLLFCLMSCSKSKNDKVDNTKPNIFLSSPTTSISVKAGGIVKVKAKLLDNIKLKTYVLKIESSGTKQRKNIEDYSFNSLTDLDAHGNALPSIDMKKEAALNFDILISEKARYGKYILSLSVLDQSDNETKLSVEFDLSHS